MTEKKPYHREDLRQELLEAGRNYVRLHGHNGLSMRTIAHDVGVSPGAPYHHFPDRRSFLLALATEGFEEMMAGMDEVSAGKLNSADKLRKMGSLFIRFAETHPHLVELMYESELTSPTIAPSLMHYQHLGHQGLRAQIIAALPSVTEEEADVRVIAFWSAIYGFSSMQNKGVIRPTGNVTVASDIAEAVVERAAISALSV